MKNKTLSPFHLHLGRVLYISIMRLTALVVILMLYPSPVLAYDVQGNQNHRNPQLSSRRENHPSDRKNRREVGSRKGERKSGRPGTPYTSRRSIENTPERTEGAHDLQRNRASIHRKRRRRSECLHRAGSNHISCQHSCEPY
jgi:hypothetical protein